MDETNSRPAIIYRSGYLPPFWDCPKVSLEFDLDPLKTVVKATALYRRRAGAAANPKDLALQLNGHESLTLENIRLNNQVLASNEFTREPRLLIIPAHLLEDFNEFELQTTSTLSPSTNLSLSGLYLSNQQFFTQCEAEGFRQITWFQDRPDIMSEYRVELRASHQNYPVLLSNGNLVEAGPLPEGRHFARWHDPFPKPSYLFALVAGQLSVREKTIQRPADESKNFPGKPALLQVWVKPEHLDRTEHCLNSLEAAIEWDRKTFGLELDLDRFMIVAVDDFNMGAMENKGLNLFNAAYVLATPQTATDQDYATIESIVGHEYFHNWTGNRVTCRDWFQLTLKEGLTVFRDQQFSADQAAASCSNPAMAASARAVARISDVATLRRLQFPEDAGPMAHPIRPEQYEDIDNFYTPTVYEKGAEVIRMLHTIVGPEGFRRGMDLYFERHDGEAVTCEDFIDAMSDANHVDLTQFMLWYSQSGTPTLVAKQEPASSGMRLIIEQCIPSGQEPFHIPVRLGWVTNRGKDQTHLVHLTQRVQSFEFEGVSQDAIASLGRGFSAPVNWQIERSSSQLSFLAQYDQDPFNRWDAVQTLASTAIRAQVGEESPNAEAIKTTAALASALEHGCIQLIDEQSLAPAYLAELLTMPSEVTVSEMITPRDAERIRASRNSLLKRIAMELRAWWTILYKAAEVKDSFATNPEQAGKRRLRGTVLTYLGILGTISKDQYSASASLIRGQFDEAQNLTEKYDALLASRWLDFEIFSELLAKFQAEYHHDPLVMDKANSALATRIRLGNSPPVLPQILQRLAEPNFQKNNPNRLRHLVGAFFSSNPAEFHSPDGSGYEFWIKTVKEVDAFNPILASRFARALDRWCDYVPTQRDMMHSALKALDSDNSLSVNVREVIGKALKHPH